jgi:hypothetical protein
MASNNADAFSANSAFPGGGGLSSSYGSGLFGDGVTGNVTITGTTTLTSEAYYGDLTIGATGILKPAGFRIFVKGTLTIDAGGSINDDGNAASGATAGALLGSRQTLGLGGGAGGAGSAGGTVGTGGSGPGGNSSLNNTGVAPTGGAGGAGTNAGGSGGAASTATQGQRWNGTAWQQQGRFSNGASTAQFNGGAGGGGGGSALAGTTGGGGGGGAGGVWIAAANIVNNGRISANGGNGGNAAGVSAGGGGGGGAGGLVCVGTLSSTFGTIQALGGLGGTATSTGAPGTNGTAGSVNVVVMS